MFNPTNLIFFRLNEGVDVKNITFEYDIFNIHSYFTPFHDGGTGASIVIGSFFTGCVKVIRRA